MPIVSYLQIRKKGFISNTYFGLKSYYLTDRRKSLRYLFSIQLFPGPRCTNSFLNDQRRKDKSKMVITSLKINHWLDLINSDFKIFYVTRLNRKKKEKN